MPAYFFLLTAVCAVSCFGFPPEDGVKYRVLISSDIGGDDEDDDQSLVHYLLYADRFETEGLISSPPGKGSSKDFLEVIDVYTHDYPRLKKYSKTYPAPGRLRKVVKQGAKQPAPACGFGQPTEGSGWIVHCAAKSDPRPLYVLVWGAITDLAQALHDAPEIKSKLRVHFIASWNQRQDSAAFNYINVHHPDLWMIHDNSTFRGWYTGGKQADDLGNSSFVQLHIKGHGALGDYFFPLKRSAIKMGDTPTVARLLSGHADDPSAESWGGRFAPVEGRPNWWTDIRDSASREAGYDGAATVSRWRELYLRDWQQRLDRLK